MKTNPFTQDELDVIRYVMIAGNLQLAVSRGIALSMGNTSHGEQLETFRVKGESICKRIFNGEVRGYDVGQA